MLPALDEAMVWLDGGSFDMGSNDFYPDEGPVREERVDGFWISPHTVTNHQFAAFVNATGHQTDAERAPDPADYPGAAQGDLVPGALVFEKTPRPVDLRDVAQSSARTPVYPGREAAISAITPMFTV